MTLVTLATVGGVAYAQQPQCCSSPREGRCLPEGSVADLSSKGCSGDPLPSRPGSDVTLRRLTSVDGDVRLPVLVLRQSLGYHARVLLGLRVLPLSHLWSTEPLLLASREEALRLCRNEGWEALPTLSAVRELEWAPRRFLSQLRPFLSECRTPQAVLGKLSDGELDRARAGIRQGVLSVLRRGRTRQASANQTVKLRRLVAQVERRARGKLSYQGRSYLLVVGDDLDGLANRGEYEVVGQAPARAILDGIAKDGDPLTELLAEARDSLSQDWRPPSSPDGLVLLRWMRVQAAGSKNDGPALTPSQVKQMVDHAALAIHVVDLKQKPQQGLAYRIVAPDGSTASGKLDHDGRAKAVSGTPGTFAVSFPDLDGADWDGDGALELPSEEERSQAETYEVAQSDRLATVARSKGFLRWQTIWDFPGNADLRELRGTPHILQPGDQLAIPSKVERTAEVPGGTAEYVVQCSAEVLRVRFAGIRSSDANPVTFKATPDGGAAIEGPLPKSGNMEVDLPPDTETVHVELFRKQDGDEAFAAYDFTVGGLDPLSEISGIKARLQNLGFYDGPIDGNLDDSTRTAIAHFRWAKLRDHKDSVDDDLLSALRAVHGR